MQTTIDIRTSAQVERTRLVAAALQALALAVGAAQAAAAASRHSMNADGISYLDIGDAYMRGDWHNAVNAVWSPMYSWVLGLALHLSQPSMRWEFPLVQLVNFAIYVFALAGFALFWGQLGRYRRARLDGETALPGWAFQALGYLLFIFSSLFLIELWSVTPDLLMAALVYLAAAIVVRGRITAQGWGFYALLGVILGLGYLTKTIMLPVGFALVVASLFSARCVRRSAPRSALALAVFLLIAGPYIALISQRQGHFTYGEGGWITDMRHVKGIIDPYWQGDAVNGSPLHPSRVILDDPPIYEFGTPIAGTYPISYDPSYWFRGFDGKFDLRQTLQAVLSSAVFYGDLFLRELGPLFAGTATLYLLSRFRRRPALQVVREWTLALVAVLMLAVYSPVLAEGRYVGVFVVLLFADLLANLSLPEAPLQTRLGWAVSAVMVLFLAGNVLVHNLEGLKRFTGASPTSVTGAAPAPRWPGEVTDELARLGVGPGSRVAVIGYAYDSFWARLGRFRIVAEMPAWKAAEFYAGDIALQSRVIAAFGGTGAEAIVSEYTPGYARLEGWRQVGASNYYVYRLGGSQ
jgi:hypothetical protein